MVNYSSSQRSVDDPHIKREFVDAFYRVHHAETETEKYDLPLRNISGKNNNELLMYTLGQLEELYLNEHYSI